MAVRAVVHLVDFSSDMSTGTLTMISGHYFGPKPHSGSVHTCIYTHILYIYIYKEREYAYAFAHVYAYVYI